jgi:predicted nucleic acid-binding protein
LIVVSDAGPLIYLGGANEIELLRKLYEGVVVPQLVHDEVVVAGAGLCGAREVAAAQWIRVENVSPDPTLIARLDRGEAAAIPLAERLGATLLVDDGGARIVARERGLHVLGTLGVLLLAKQEGYVPFIAPIVRRMTSLGMFVSAPLRSRVLAAAGEEET